MDNRTDISIVIPVYNLEAYIEQCVESIFPVKEPRVEILLVDDGSTDGSGKKCEELAEKHPEVRVIHKPNGGAADTRNAGMKAAESDYIMFVDGDDFLAPGAVDTVWRNLRNAPQILTFDYFEYYGGEDIVPMRHLNASVFTDGNGEILPSIFKTCSPLPMPWLYVVSADYIRKHQIYMHKGLLDEDEEWTARLFAHAEKIENLHENLYYYRRNRAHSLTFNRKLANVKADIEIIRILQREKESGNYRLSGCVVLDNKRRQMVSKVLDDLPSLNADERSAVKQELRPYMSLLKSGAAVDRIHYFLDNVIGRKNTDALIRWIAKRKK